MDAGEVVGGSIVDLRAHLATAPHDQWILINSSGPRPLGRYKHSAHIVEEKLYVIGGSRNGRHLSDIQVFNFRTSMWSTLSMLDNDKSKKVVPALAGHSMVKWENKLFIVAGLAKEALDTTTVWSVDLETNNYYVVNTHGIAPTAREGHSVTLVGSRMLIFGGVDSRRQVQNDLHILDLSTMIWGLVQTKNMPPTPRFDHIAAIHSDQYLLIFGGSSHLTCFSDLHVLDLQTMEWSLPETQGVAVAPRGGHAGAIVDDHWYIVGGGDSRSGATETIVLNMSKFVWSLSTSVNGRDPLASEGLTVCPAVFDGVKFIVAFGGYNGKYNNELFVLKPKLRDSVQPKLFQSPAAAAAAASVTAAYALTTTTDNYNNLVNGVGASLKLAQPEFPKNVAVSDTSKITSDKKSLESEVEEVINENLRLNNSLDKLNNSHSLLIMELQSVQGQLTAESSRCVKLEIQIAEIQKRLESLSSIKHKLEVLQQQKIEIEQDVPASQRNSSGGIWQWVTGTAQSS